MVRLKLTTRKRYYEEGADYFITTKTHKNYPYFKNEILCELFIEELKVCKEIKKFELYAFCIIYDHVHLLVKPRDEIENISRIMQFLKRHFSRSTNFILGYNVGDIRECRLRSGEFEDLERLIEEHDKAIIQLAEEFKIDKKNRKTSIPKFRWQKSFHDHIISNENDFDEHHGYTIYNHLKHYLPENWQYTSLNYENLIDDFQ